MFDLAKIFRSQEGIKELYNEFVVDALGINPAQQEKPDFTKPTLIATE